MMARGSAAAEEASDFEKQRLANIAERDALLKKLTSEAQAQGQFPPPAAVNGTQKKRPAKPKGPPAKRIKKEDIQPRRVSSRLKGIEADSEVARQKEEKEYEERKVEEQKRRERKVDDVWFDGSLLIGTDTLLKGVAKPGERTFDSDDVKETTDKDVKALREKMSGLKLWGEWDPGRIKLVPERIYSMSFNPTADKPVVFAGDKLGNLGIIDASQSNGDVKKEDDEDDDDPDPVISQIKPHTRTISAMHTHPSKPGTLFTASYDSSIRGLDLQKGVAVEIYGPEAKDEDDPISGIDMAIADPNVVYFTTLNGGFGQYDTRTKANEATTYQLSEKKIGGFSLHPLAPHYLATASLDRTMKLWDLRKITKKLPTLVGEHESRLSVSHAAFNSAGQVATSSYDDTLKIYSFGLGQNTKKGTDALESMKTWKAGHQLDEDVMKPEVVVRHNNQTGRWVTILRPQWQRRPQDGHQKFVIGNMNRFVDVYAADGTQLAQLGDDLGENRISAVPAVSVLHETQDWVAAGTASGKLCLWM
jgi:WD repeat-containing protein 76